MMNPEDNFLHANNQPINLWQKKLLLHYFLPVLHIFYHYLQDCFIF
ncbi:hypothetical protein SAMN05216168_4269 [Kosakonia radicincitans]|nr:hypothetical protein SAMN05216168_4269 [Kosakonia radicincitans]